MFKVASKSECSPLSHLVIWTQQHGVSDPWEYLSVDMGLTKSHNHILVKNGVGSS